MLKNDRYTPDAWSKSYDELGVREDMDKQLERAGAKDLSKTLEQIGQTSGKDDASPSEERLAGELESASPIKDYDAPDQEHEWRRSDTGKWFYYGEPGKRYYQSGAIYQEGKGLVKPADNTLITVDNTAEYAEKRLTKAQNKALEGMREAIADNRNLTEVKPGDEAKYWGIAVTERMLAGEKDSMVAARLLGEGPLELLGRRGEGAGSPTNGQVSLTLTGNVSDLRQVMGNRYAQGGDNNIRDDVIDAEVTDHSTQE